MTYLIKFWDCKLVIIALLLLHFSACKEDADTSIKDGDGNVYTSVIIGTQVWLKENLKTTSYKDGTAIPLVTDNSEWAGLNAPAYCWYENDGASNKNVYGALYNWYTVNTRQLCPTGWHVPSDAEWTILSDFLGGISIAGGKLKETGVTDWESPNTGATNEAGFSALPGGFRDIFGSFSSIGLYFIGWSSTGYDSQNAYYRNISFDRNSVLRLSIPKEAGFSVRCVRDY